MDKLQTLLNNATDAAMKGNLRLFTMEEKAEAINVLNEKRFNGLGTGDYKALEEYILNTPIAFNKKYIHFCKMANSDLDPEYYSTLISAATYEAVALQWNKTKQSYKFDKYFIEEMGKTTKGINLPHLVFDKLPFKTVYLDISQNPKSGKNGALVNVRKIAEHSNGEVLWMLTMLNVAVDKILSSISLIIEDPVGGKELDFDALGNDNIDNEALYTQLLIYLCSYEPDIRDDAASKMQYKKAKQARKKGVKAELPVQKHMVGERFGEAFRKWTVSTLGKSSDRPEGHTGVHVKPHIRRAHWHRYWIGKRDNKELIIKWVHECYCGTTEDDAKDTLDIVKHKVN